MTAMPPTKLRSALLLRFGGIISAAISMILCRTPPACPLFGTIASLRFASKALPFSAAIKQYFHTVQNQPAGRISRSAGPVHSPLRKLLHTLLQSFSILFCKSFSILFCKSFSILFCESFSILFCESSSILFCESFFILCCKKAALPHGKSSACRPAGRMPGRQLCARNIKAFSPLFYLIQPGNPVY